MGTTLGLCSPVNEASGPTRGFVQLQKALFRTLHQPVNPDLEFWQPFSPRHVWKQKAASSLAWPSFHDHVPDVSALPPCVKVVHICVPQICSKKHLLKLTPLEIWVFFSQSFKLSEDEVLYLNSGRLAEVSQSSVGSLSSPHRQLLAEAPLIAV